MKKALSSIFLAVLIALSFVMVFSSPSSAQEENNKNLEKRRTIKEFEYTEDVFLISDKWAEENGYHVLETDLENNKKIYKKNNKFPYAPVLCSIEQNNDKVHLEGWVKVPFAMRMVYLFIPPKEVNLKPNAIGGRVPRNIGRETINRLMMELNQDFID